MSEKGQSNQAKAQLLIALHEHREQHGGSATTHRLGLTARGEAIRNLDVDLADITPRPHAHNFRGEFPYVLDTSQTLNTGQQHRATVAQSWKSSDNRRILSGLDGTLDPNLHTPNRIAMGDDEEWPLTLRVTGENIEARTVIVHVKPLPDGRTRMSLDPSSVI